MLPPLHRVFRADGAVWLVGTVLAVEAAALPFRDLGIPAWETLLGLLQPVLTWASLGLRHRWPVGVAVFTLLVSALHYPLSELDCVTPMISFVLALYTVTRSGRLVPAVVIAVTAVLGIAYGEFVLGAADDRHVDNAALVLLSGWMASLILFGHTMRVRQAYQSEAEQRALAAERERDVRALQSATEERLRLARELHDVLGHNISLISVQTAAALHRSAKRPGETAELIAALTSVRDTSKEALRELRATLGVLRQVDEAAPVEPAPAGLERLAELAGRAGATGLAVTVTTEGDAAVVPPQISLAAYRIVQESLTNVTRHARATRADVTLSWAPGELRLRIEDDGRGTPDGPPVAGGGSGIGGMAERARALGGGFEASGTGDGFRVAAWLPLPQGAADGVQRVAGTTTRQSAL
ncbi:sensor histidine kinase [Streptomyces avicenniae]|uniref:sensor histidine kinase n=1 Tax=Streptomyces avicenniae TaxID=500153 RepID=UPI000DA6123B|nr:sensor histidine kinase [Streptomyces avicenniae]